MTIILTTVAATIILGYYFSKSIRKYAFIFYGLAGVAAIFYGSHEANILSLGYVPFGIFLVVMFMGVMDKGEFKSKLLNIRGELAIIAFILLIPHAWGYFEYYLEYLGIFSGTIAFYLGILAVLLAVPLIVTSFRKIRSIMGYKKWKKLHLFSYLFYLLVALHLVLINNLRFLSYLIIFGIYMVMKIAVLIKQNLDRQNRLKQKNALHKTS